MKFPRLRIPVALAVLAALAWPVAAPTSPTTSVKAAVKTAKAKTAKPAAKPKKGTKAWKKDSIRVADSLRKAESGLRLDSLRRDSLHRIDSIRAADSLHLRDSLVRIDSLRRSDSLRRVDSLDRASRTWYVARPRDFVGTPEAIEQTLEKTRIQLLRTGDLWMADRGVRDTCSAFDCSWKNGLASGAGRLLYGALYRTADSGWKLSSWLFELPSGGKIDSVVVMTAKNAPKPLDELARRTTSLLHPSPSEAACRADSLSQAGIVWGYEAPVNHTTDSTLGDRILGHFAAEFARTGRAKAFALPATVHCPDRRCLDSLATAAGAGKALRFDISRLLDSSWRLGLVAVSAADSTASDSFVVTAPSLEALAAKATSILVPAPANCRSFCGRANPLRAKLVWSVGGIGSDTTDAQAAKLLEKRISNAFAHHAGNQFFPTISIDTTKDSLGSAPRAAATTGTAGIDRIVVAHLDGSDSLWNLSATFRDPRNDSLVDSIRLSRGGWRPRVFDWFARKLVEAAHPLSRGCESPCSEDSTSVANTGWAFPPTTDQIGDVTLAKLLNDNLVGTMVSRKLGKTVSFPDSLPCATLRCMDSIAASRGAKHVVWTRLSRAEDSSWRMSAWVTESATDLVIDSTHQSDTGNPIEALAHLPERVLEALVPTSPRCDSCVSLDTLEAGLALIEPKWTDVADTLQNIFLDSLRGVLSRDGHYQVLPWAASDSVYAPWKSKDCDTACRAALRCRTGASFMVSSAVARDGSGWRVSAKLTDLRSGKVVSEMTTREARNDAQRLREIAPWTARKLIGTDTTAVAPASRRPLDIPWAKVIALVIPFTAGLVSVISRW